MHEFACGEMVEVIQLINRLAGSLSDTVADIIAEPFRQIGRRVTAAL